KRRGANYIACCPFHNEKTPSFYVSPAKGIFKCFGCGKSGTAVGFVMEHESLSYAEALKFLAAKYHIEVQEKEETAEEIALRQRNESLLLVSDFAGKFFQESLATEEGRSIGYAYFRSRGLEDETIRKFGLGWAPVSRNALASAARAAGYKEEFLVATGLCVKRDDGSLSDRFYDRAMFPIHSVSGRIIAFGGRTLRTDKSVAKYVNSPETEIYVKSRSLYGIYYAKNEISRRDRCYLVEGYLDVISMHQLGITNVVASSGTSLTVEQIRLIRKFTENVTIIYDGDSAGIHAALRGIGLVLKEGLNVKVVLLPDGDDPDSYSRKHTFDEVENFIAVHEQDFISFKSDLLLNEAGGDPLKKANLINDIADTIALIPDAVKRSVYVETCSAKFNIEAQILFDRIAKTRGEMLVADKKQQEREEQKQASGYQTDGQEQAETEIIDLPAASVFNDPYLVPCEKEILGFILNHGQDLLKFDVDSEFYVEGEPAATVADFIDGALAANGTVFSNDILRSIYDMYFDLYEEGLSQEQIQKRLMDSGDRALADMATELIVEKYLITVKNFQAALTADQTRMVMFVPKAILAYQEKIVGRRQKEWSDKLAALQSDDVEEMKEILKKVGELTRIRKALIAKMGRA
ncbi:MAG: DNA primase, partial [Bacteroidales bacterium]|nr:DNA primase [Bacteroidales bacterium]